MKIKKIISINTFSLFYKIQLKYQFQHFATGFLKVVDGKALHLFTPNELEGIVEGEVELDFKELEKHSTYEGGFDKDHPYVRKVWEVLHEFQF